MSSVENKLRLDIEINKKRITRNELKVKENKNKLKHEKQIVKDACSLFIEGEMSFHLLDQVIDKYSQNKVNYDIYELTLKQQVEYQKKLKKQLKEIIQDRRQAEQNAVKRFVKSEARLMEFLSNPENKAVIEQYHTNKKGE